MSDVLGEALAIILNLAAWAVIITLVMGAAMTCLVVAWFVLS